MVIYGVALLAGCMLAGVFIGELIGELIGVDANVGGVGISMLLLILITAKARSTGRLRPVSQTGITFWSAIYIPVVVAMAASQNVVAAVRGGTAAVLAGVLAVVVGCALVPLLSHIGGEVPPPLPKDTDKGLGG
jgi:malonate transporter MadL subunit